MSVKIGKPKDQNGNKKNYFKLKDGDNVYMVLPPLGELADKGQWNKYLAVHYGYKDSKGYIKPFLSTEVINYKTKMIEVPDAALDRTKQLEASYQDALKNRDIEGAKRLKSLKERYNVDKKYYMNAMTLDGQLGILKIPYKSMEVFKQEIARQKSAGVDVMDPVNGRFIVFRRSGMGRDTAHQVFTYKEKIKVEGLGEVEKEKVASLDESAMSRLESEVSLNLTKIVKEITSDEIALVVEADLKGDLSVIDAILGSSSNSNQDAPPPEEEDQIPEDKLKAAPVETKTEAKAETKTDLKKAVDLGKAAEAKVETKSTPDVNNMSEEDFLKMING